MEKVKFEVIALIEIWICAAHLLPLQLDRIHLQHTRLELKNQELSFLFGNLSFLHVRTYSCPCSH